MYRMYLYKFLVDFWVIVPVLVPFYRMHELGMTQILLVQGIFSLSQMLCEIPSGYFSDVLGRRKTLVLAGILMTAGIGIYTVAEGFMGFAVAEIVLGCASAMRSGTDSAFLYDQLKSIRNEHQYKRCEGIAEFWSRSGTAISAVLGGALGAYATLRLPFYVNIATACGMVCVGISLREPVRDTRPKGSPFKNITRVALTSVTHPQLLPAMVRMGLLFSTGVTAIWGYFNLYTRYEIPLFWHGILFAVMQLFSACGAKFSEEIESRLGSVAGVVLFVPGVLFILIGVVPSVMLLLPLVMLHAILWGMSTPLLLECIQKNTTSDVRATTLSVGSIIGRILTFGWGPVFGWITDHASTGTAFLWMGVFFYAVNMLFMIRFRRN